MMIFSRFFLRRCFSGLFCYPVFLASGFAAETDGAVTLRVQGLPNPASTDAVSIADQRVLEVFQQRHPHIKIRPAEGLRLESVNSQATTIMMIAGGIAPDVIRMNFRSIDSFVRQGMIASLDGFIQEAQDGGQDPLARILPRILPVITRHGPDGKPAIYGMPGPPVVVGLFFNRELFRRAGLPSRAPKDWNELADFARKISALGPRYHGIYLASGISASWNLMNFLWTAGGDAVQEVSPGEWRAVFDTPEAVAAFEFYYQLVEVDRVAIRYASTPTQRDLENIGMMFRYVGDSVNYNADIWGFGVVPKGPSGQRGSEVNAPIFGIYSGVEEPAKKQAAWEYIHFLTGEEAERIRIETLVEMGQASQVNPVLLRRFGFDQHLAFAATNLESEFEEAFRHGRPEPFGKNCNLVYNEITLPLDQMLLSEKIRADWMDGNRTAVREEIQAMLTRAVARTNERMIGYVAPAEMAKRRTVATLVALVVFGMFLFVGWYVIRIFSRNASMLSRPVAGRSLIPWLCLFPALSLILIWSYLPLVRGTAMAFLDYQLILESQFVWLDNFANVLYDGAFWNSILATLHFAAWTLTLGFVTPILLAYGLHLIPKHKIFYRTVYYLPAVISGTAVFFLWRELFSIDGVLNQFLRLLGFEARRAWPDDPYLAMLACIIPGTWAGAGPGCLIYLAALKTIPAEQFEASEIDGAGFWHKTTKIVYPGLRALVFINFVGAVAAAFHGATYILIMTGGGPNGLTEVTSLLIFYEAFTRLRFGPATAMAWIVGSMLIGFTVIQLKRLSQMEFKTAK